MKLKKIKKEAAAQNSKVPLSGTGFEGNVVSKQQVSNPPRPSPSWQSYREWGNENEASIKHKTLSKGKQMSIQELYQLILQH
jgi:hypothetical protein